MARIRELFRHTFSNEKEEDIVGSELLRALMTASLVDSSNDAEVKLLTLWAAFEAMLPSVPDEAKNRIEPVS